MLTQARLFELLHYDPETGAFTWRVSRGRVSAGATAGSLMKGYVEIRVDGKRYGAHRLAFLYMTGAWPVDEAEHRDLNRANNRWANLREATHAQNACNMHVRAHNKSGFKGVRKSKGRFQAHITLHGERIYLGSFDTAPEAHAIYVRASKDLHGEFGRAA